MVRIGDYCHPIVHDFGVGVNNDRPDGLTLTNDRFGGVPGGDTGEGERDGKLDDIDSWDEANMGRDTFGFSLFSSELCLALGACR